MATYQTTSAPIHNGMTILQGGPGRGCRKDILDRLGLLFSQALTRHSKVFFIRFDMRFPQDRAYPPNNVALSRFLDSFTRDLKGRGLDPSYLWVRERHTGEHHHYHFCLFLDGHKTQRIHNHMATAERLWASALGLPPTEGLGLIDHCTRDRNGLPQENGIMIRKDHLDWENVRDRSLKWGSYLSKTHSKGNAPHNVREWGSSRLVG